MKKRNTIIIVLILITILSIMIYKNNKNTEKTSLIIVSNYNMKYGASFGGTAIFNDGSIYTWYFSSTKSDYNSYVGSYSINTKEGFKKFVIDKGKKKEERVSNKDLSKIKRIIKKIKNEDTLVNCNVDEIKYSETVIYKQDEIFKISTSEECNTTKDNIIELLSIINKYKKK